MAGLDRLSKYKSLRLVRYQAFEGTHHYDCVAERELTRDIMLSRSEACRISMCTGSALHFTGLRSSIVPRFNVLLPRWKTPWARSVLFLGRNERDIEITQQNRAMVYRELLQGGSRFSPGLLLIILFSGVDMSRIVWIPSGLW